MKLSYKQPNRAACVFSIFMWLKYLIEIKEPVIDELHLIKEELSEKYNQPMEEITEKVIDDSIKCTGKVFLSGQESYSRIPSNLLVIISVYKQRHNIDMENVQSYIIDNLTVRHHENKISMVLSEMNDINGMISDVLRMYEGGINYND